MPEYLTNYPMTSLTLDAIACKEEDAVVVDYILKGTSYNFTFILQSLQNIRLSTTCVANFIYKIFDNLSCSDNSKSAITL